MADVYVDPTNGDDGAGDGSSGSPYASLEYAVSNGTFSTTSGNSIFLANTSANVLSATLDVTSVATLEAPLVIQAWDNGGSLTVSGPLGRTFSPGAKIDGNDAATYILQANARHVTLKNLELFDTTSSVLFLNDFCSVINCHIHGSGSTSYTCFTNGHYFNSLIDAGATGGYAMYNVRSVRGCEVKGGDEGIRIGLVGGVIEGNLIHDFDDTGILVVGDFILVAGNTIDGSGSNGIDAIGIENGNQYYEAVRIFNNLVTNFDGTGEKGIYFATGSPCGILGNNAFYNNDTDIDAPTAAYTIANVTETSDPYTDSANNDYSLVSGAASIGAAIITNADPDNPDNIGAWQDYSSGGGGATPGMTAHVTVA